MEQVVPVAEDAFRVAPQDPDLRHMYARGEQLLQAEPEVIVGKTAEPPQSFAPDGLGARSTQVRVMAAAGASGGWLAGPTEYDDTVVGVEVQPTDLVRSL
jgi:hypothetical protein